MADSTKDEKLIKRDASSSSSQPSTECESSSANSSAPLTANTSHISGVSTDDAKPQGTAPLGTSESAADLDVEKPPTRPNVRFDGLDNTPDEDDDDVDDLSDPDEAPPAPDPFSTSYPRRRNRENRYSNSYGNPYDTSFPRPKSLEERTVKAPKQVKQIVQYTKLMEDRVQALESEVRLLKGSRLAEPIADPFFGAPASKDSASYPAYDYGKSAPESFQNLATANPREAKKPPMSLEKYKYIAAIHRMSEPEYRAAYLGEDEQKYVIDVMIQEQTARPPSQATVVAARKTDESLKADHASIKGRSGSIIESPTPHTNTVPKSLPKPQRIRINSKRLLDELCAVTDQVKDPSLSQFLAPFQLFTQYEQKIRDHTQVLEVQCRGEVKTATKSEETPETEEQGKEIDSKVENENGAPKPAAENASENENEDLDEIDSNGADIPGHDILDVMEACQIGRKEAVKVLKEHHFSTYAIPAVLGKLTPEERLKVDAGVAKLILAEWRALIAFLDEDLKSTLETCSQIRSGTLKAIAYDDLSYLYKPGDIVISTQNRRLQAYTVIATSGGRELLTDSIITGPPNPADPPKEALPIRTVQRYSPFVVDCWYYDFAGIGLECISKSITIPKYDDLKAVTSLALYPEALHDDRGRDLMAGLKSRGQKFIQLCSEADLGHRQYLGRTFDDTPEEVDSQVIIDCHMAATVLPEHRPDLAEWVPVGGAVITTEPDEREIVEYDAVKDKTKPSCSLGPSCTICNPAVASTRIFNDQKFNRQKSQEYFSEWTYLDRTIPVEEFKEDDLVLLPPRVFGFILRSRKWARLDIDRISDITTEGNGFKKLVLPEGYAELVQALVETHFKDPPPETEKTKLRHDVDLVRGKGKGLIILLHGAPGVGKTSTAESVAEFTKRPLYPITCGDIGETAREVELNLDRCFRQAHRWGCVLLLDEADVFLAKRDKSDLKRNALVSVFLRVLEYYAGILFLTTNRVGAFDDAFKSRIHMSLYYPDLDRKSTMQVWEMNLDRTQENMKDIVLDRDKIMEFAEKQYKKAEKEGKGLWNGRQIRNAFQTAIALAEWLAKKEGLDPETGKPQAAKLTANRFRKVAKASAEFDDYLERAHGVGEAERAQHLKERVAEERIVEREAKKSKSKAKSSSRKQKKSRNEDDDEEKPAKSKPKKRQESSSSEESDTKSSSEEN